MIRFAKLHEDAILPKPALPGALGLDVCAYIKRADQDGKNTVPSKAQIAPGMTKNIHTGIVAIPPPGMYFQLCSRSGIAGKSVFVANAPGIIDPDYVGEIRVLLYNGGMTTFWVEDGQRIGQLILCAAVIPDELEIDVIDVSEVPETTRGDKGFGSTG